MQDLRLDLLQDPLRYPVRHVVRRPVTYSLMSRMAKDRAALLT